MNLKKGKYVALKCTTKCEKTKALQVEKEENSLENSNEDGDKLSLHSKRVN